jgi:hypothetical protein
MCSPRSRSSAAALALAEQGRRFAHDHRAGTERFDGEAEARQFVAARHEIFHRRRIELDDFGDQQELPRTPSRSSDAFSRS